MNNIFLSNLNEMLFPMTGIFASSWRSDYISNEIELILRSRCGVVSCILQNNTFEEEGAVQSVLLQIQDSHAISEILKDRKLGNFFKSELFEELIKQIIFPLQMANIEEYSGASGDYHYGHINTSSIVLSYINSCNFDQNNKVIICGEIPSLDEYNYDIKLSSDLQISINEIKDSLTELFADTKIFEKTLQNTHTIFQSPVPESIPGILKFHSMVGLVDYYSSNNIYIGDK